MRASRQITVVFSVLLIACIAGSVLLLRGLDRLRSHATLEEVLYIPSPKAIKRLSLGYDGLLADIYWTRAVQYFGNKHNAGAENFNLLAPLLEITTTLDPHFFVAYEYGSNFLAPQPRTAPACLIEPSNSTNLVFATTLISGGCITTSDSSTTRNCTTMLTQPTLFPVGRVYRMRIPS